MIVLPKISIITVVRNGEEYLESTIQSIIGQTYGNIEYIIIDGNSTDNTVNIIKKYQNKISYWVSEKDEGIYDAMNKGAKASTGDWILFINSDDFLVDDFVIEKAASYLKDCNNLVAYGNAAIIYSSGPESVQGLDWDKLKYTFRNIRMNLSHQATFHSGKLFANQAFDKSFKIAGDYDFLLRHLKDHDAYYFPLTIAKRRAIGISATVGAMELLMDIRKAQLKNKIYKFIPSFSWMTYNLRLILNDQIIKIIGIERKEQLKQVIARLKY